MSLPDRLLDAACCWLAAHPRYTTAIIVALILGAHGMEGPF